MNFELILLSILAVAVLAFIYFMGRQECPTCRESKAQIVYLRSLTDKVLRSKGIEPVGSLASDEEDEEPDEEELRIAKLIESGGQQFGGEE